MKVIRLLSATYSAVHLSTYWVCVSVTLSATYSAVHKLLGQAQSDKILSATYSAVHCYRIKYSSYLSSS